MAAITAFELRLRSSFEKYLQQLDAVYAMELRWPESPFWQSVRPFRPERAALHRGVARAFQARG